VAGRHNTYDPSRVALLTTAGADGHTHVARFDDDGNGITSEAADGHWHTVSDCDVLPAVDGHTHELTDQRQTDEEDERAAPVWRPGRAAQAGRATRRAERREVA
jgi:hypothetical protein